MPVWRNEGYLQVRITYVGNQLHSFCTEVHLAATLRDLGHEVVFCQENTTSVEGIMNVAITSDLLIYTRTWGHPQPVEFLAMLQELKARGIKTASYHLDLYVGLHREASIVGDPFWATEYVFTPDGSQTAADFFAAHGINHHYIKPGVFKPECVPGTYHAELDKAVIFVGTGGEPGHYHDEWPYRHELVQWLRQTFGPAFGKFGGEQGTVRGQQLNDLYASSRVVVGDSLCLNFERDHYWSDRVYETVGRGGFLIHPYIVGLEEEFTAGEQLEFYTYKDFDGLYELIDYYVKHPEEARAIADRGQAYVRENCTYHNRLQQALEIMDLSG